MSHLFPATHSILSAPALLVEISSDYDIGRAHTCRLWNRGLNDTYLIKTDHHDYMLRVYRANWRSAAEIRYELDVLAHLEQKGIPVATPLRRNDGTFIRALNAPEGTRYMVLFRYAPGQALSYDEDVSIAVAYGSAVGRIHAALDDFDSPHARFRLDLNHLIDTPLVSIQPLLAHRAADWHYLQRLADHLRGQIASLPQGALAQGVCHGDFHGWNAHISDDKIITFFDFDCCGWGWRAYDIAVFRWSVKLFTTAKEQERWQHFVQGYTQEHPLNAIDQAVVPLFIGIRHIWLMGLQTGNGQDWGFGWMNDAYFDRALTFLRTWEPEFTIETSSIG
jgi:Ser/Thr protein kinase RdoA (MazF antagonist)